MVRYSDRYRRSVIREIHVRARVIWDPQEPGFYSSGARKYAFDGVADRLGHILIVHNARFDNAGGEDLRRMWRQWVRAFHAYKLRRVSRKPKYYVEMSLLDELMPDQLHAVAAMY